MLELEPSLTRRFRFRTHNVADALTKSLPSPSFLLHRPFLTGTRQEYTSHFSHLGINMPEARAAAAA